MLARDDTRAHDIVEDAIGFEEQMFLGAQFDFLAHYGVYEGHIGEVTVIEFGNSLYDLAQSRLGDEHRLEYTVCGVRIGVLFDTSSGEGSVTDIHSVESILEQQLIVDIESHMNGFLFDESNYESEEIVDTVAADVVFELVRYLTAQRIDTKADRVDEIAMVSNVVAVVGDTSHIDGVSFAFKEAFEALFVVFGEVPISSPVVACATGHDAEVYLSALFGGDIGRHDAVECLAECTVSAKHEYLVIATLYEVTRQFGSMAGVLGDTVGEGLVSVSE